MIDDNGRHVALLVDELVGKQEVVIKSLGVDVRRRCSGIAGGAIMGDGRVGLILDAAGSAASDGESIRAGRVGGRADRRRQS